ncbi:unnamed protein product [Arctogadus glacialis]
MDTRVYRSGLSSTEIRGPSYVKDNEAGCDSLPETREMVGVPERHVDFSEREIRQRVAYRPGGGSGRRGCTWHPDHDLAHPEPNATKNLIRDRGVVRTWSPDLFGSREPA